MAKKSNSSDYKKASKMSSGLRKVHRANQEIMRLKMKINRWERHQGECTSGKRIGDAERWDTAGLEKRMSQLQEIAR